MLELDDGGTEFLFFLLELGGTIRGFMTRDFSHVKVVIMDNGRIFEVNYFVKG